MKEVRLLMCCVGFYSRLSLDEVAAVLAARLFGGIQFSREDSRCFDEFPSRLLESEVLGMRIYVRGWPGERGYCLLLSGKLPKSTATQEQHLQGIIATFESLEYCDGPIPEPHQDDITNYVAYLMRDIPEITLHEDYDEFRLAE